MAPKLFYHIFEAFLLFLVLKTFVLVESTRPLSSKSLQNLVGAKKGDTFNGLYQVKQYLKAFGYYPNDINVADHTDDHFDGILESALKSYQQNLHLKVTGKLDPDTIKAIVTPRCGCPDVIPNRTSNVHFHLVANYSFFDGSPSWKKYQLTYTFLRGIQVVDVKTLRDIISRAFEKWAAISPFRFQEAAQGTQADLGIGFYQYDHGDRYPFDGHGNTLAHAFPPEIGQFHYDASESWSQNPTSEEVDLESVAVHEIGHLLGLGHSRDPNAVMYPTIPYGTIKRKLGQDDINGLRALYGYNN